MGFNPPFTRGIRAIQGGPIPADGSPQESIHSLSVYGWLSPEHRLKFSLDVRNGAPDNAYSRTRNYEITLIILGDGGITLSEPFLLSMKVHRSSNQ